MEDLIGDIHLPNTLDEIKNSIEVIDSTYDTMDWKIQLMQQEIVNNISSVASGLSQSQPYIGKGFNKSQGS